MAGRPQQWGQYRAPASSMSWGQRTGPSRTVAWGQRYAPLSSMCWEQRGQAGQPHRGVGRRPSARSSTPWTSPGVARYVPASPPFPANSPRNNPPHVVWCGPAPPQSRRGSPPVTLHSPYVSWGLDHTAPRYSPMPMRKQECEAAMTRRPEQGAPAEVVTLPTFRAVAKTVVASGRSSTAAEWGKQGEKGQKGRRA